MSNTGKIIRVNTLPPIEERENNVIYQVAAPGAATYTDYAIDENGDIKTHVGYFNPEDLVDYAVNISTPEFLEEGIETQKEFNLNIREQLGAKLNKPSTTGTTSQYTEVLGFDHNGNAAKLPAGDLGKNIANSSLISIEGAGLTLGADWALETEGKKYSISGLNNVSNDSTFNTFLSQNENGQLGKTNGVQPFLTLPNILTEEEKTAWKTAMNGGWTTNTMSIALINPVAIHKIDAPQYVTLIGSNLNLNPTNFTVEIIDSAGIVVIETIPNSQVQLDITGTSMMFWYNFKDLPLSDYKIRLWNGVASYITPMTFKLVEYFQNVDMNAITWEVNTYADKTNPHISLSPTTVNAGQNLINNDNTDFYELSALGEYGLTTSITSSPLQVDGIDLTMNDNFLIEFFIVSDNGATPIDGGICFDTVPVFGDTISKGIFCRGNYGSYDGGNLSYPIGTPFRCILIKMNNSFVTAFSTNTGRQSVHSIITPNNNKIRLKVGRRAAAVNNWSGVGKFQLVNAYKF